MKKIYLMILAVIIGSAGIYQTASAQFPIKMPKIGKPKTEQPKQEQTTTAQQPTSSSSSSTTMDGNTSKSNKPVATEATIAKDWVQVTPYTYSSYQKNYDVWSWTPMISFIVNGPIASGDQVYAEFNIPGTGIVKFDCRTGEKAADQWLTVKNCGGDSVPEEKGSKYTGVVTFSIKMRNELAGADQTLFSGKAKILKAHSNEAQTPKFVNHFVYYADHDWNLPIGYVFYTEDTQKGMARPILNLAFWVRGDSYDFQPHLFYQGKEVGKMYYADQEVGKANCQSETENGTTNYVADNIPQKAKWARIICTIGNVRGWDKTGEGPNMFGSLYTMDKNPGEYELKVLRSNHLARSIKFTVKPDGSFDNGIGTANKLGDDRTIVPVQIIGDQDGVWDKAAWKTDAFYGNPLTGFTALP